MSYLINRNPSGRLVCIYSLLKYLNNRFGKSTFNLKDLKYDAGSKFNIHQTCNALIKLPSISYKICPYLENPLSDAKCYLTQSIQEDKQKSKSVSESFNVLEGMGFVKRTSGGGIITPAGAALVSEPYESENTLKRLQQGLLSYGPFIGFLYEISQKGKIINRSDIELGYPVTDEKLILNNRTIKLSTGSQQDTITRTRSVLFIWALTAGYLLPKGITEPKNNKLWHVEMQDYAKLKKWNINQFKIMFKPNFFSKKRFVSNPLSYDSMTKSTKALRERNQEEERAITLKYEPIINNRRLALVYGLNKKSEVNKSLDLDSYIKELLKYPKFFVINEKDFERTMEIELGICSVCGIPFKRKGNILYPLTTLNTNELIKGAPTQLIDILNKILMKI